MITLHEVEELGNHSAVLVWAQPGTTAKRRFEIPRERPDEGPIDEATFRRGFEALDRQSKIEMHSLENGSITVEQIIAAGQDPS